MFPKSCLFLIHSAFCWRGVFAELDWDAFSDSSVQLLQISTSLVDNATHEAHVALSDSAGLLEHRPVFFMHEVGGYAGQFDLIIDMMRKANSTRKLISLDVFEFKESFNTPLIRHVNGIISSIRAAIADDPTAFSNGYDLVGHAIGGLLMRAVVETMDDHNVKTLISLAGVQGGHYCTHYPCTLGVIYWPGRDGDVKEIPVSISKKDAANIYVREYFWMTGAFTNVYRDIQRSVFLEGNTFLPRIDCLLEDADNQRKKSNFLRLKRAIFTGGINGPTLPVPDVSQFFEFFAENDTSTIVPLSEQPVYTQDTFGLRTLDEDGRLTFIRAPGVTAHDWLLNESVIVEYVLPLLGVGTMTSTEKDTPVHGSSIKSIATGISFFIMLVITSLSDV